ncbi:MAG TPA: nucleotidyltransferase family protein, partial [Bryobacteraceae bacterium]|nr:nucleotidyltransferase family protein [Bryobacteraceae bacterium]
VDRPEYFDAVVTDEVGRVMEIQVKKLEAKTKWVWGAFKLTGKILRELHALWCQPDRRDEYIGTLVNAWLGAGGKAYGVHAGEQYVDVGTLHGYRQAMSLLGAAHDRV